MESISFGEKDKQFRKLVTHVDIDTTLCKMSDDALTCTSAENILCLYVCAFVIFLYFVLKSPRKLSPPYISQEREVIFQISQVESPIFFAFSKVT